MAIDTAGGETVYLSGTNFGPSGLGGTVEVFYGTSNDPFRYNASACDLRSDHTELACTTARGSGFHHVWTVRVGGQISVRSSFTTDYRTEIERLCVDYPTCSQTPTAYTNGYDPNGSRTVVTLVGVNFGSARATRTVYFQSRDVNGKLLDGDFTRVDVSAPACAASDPTHLCTEELLQFFLPPGVGADVPVSVSIDEPEEEEVEPS